MPAAATKARIKAPVGADPRPEFSEGGKVKNAPADVMVVQRLLAAAGQKAEVNGRVNGALIKAISAFQKANGFKKPDGVVDPGGRTFKALVKKAAAGKGPSVEIEVLQVVVKGKTYPVTPKDFDKLVAETCKKLDRVLAAMKSQYQTIDDTAQFYIDAATGATGFMDALVMWASSVRAGLKEPSFSKGPAAWGALMKVDKALKSKDLRKAIAAMPAAKKAVNEYAREVEVYGNKFAGGAKKMQESLELVRDTSFELATYIATGYLMARGKVDAGNAKAAAGALFGMIKSASTQYGRSLAGYNDSALDNARTIMFETIMAGVKGKLNGAMFDKMGKSVAAHLVKDPPFSYLGAGAVQNMYRAWMRGAGKQAVTEMFDGTVAVLTDAGKAGIRNKNFDWPKEIEKKLTEGLFKVATAGFLGNVGKAQDKLGTSLARNARAAASDATMLKKLRLDRNAWFKALPAKEQFELMKGAVESVAGNLGNDALKSAWGNTAAKLKGNESPQAIADAVARNVMTDKAFLKAVEKHVAAQGKKLAKKK